MHGSGQEEVIQPRTGLVRREGVSRGWNCPMWRCMKDLVMASYWGTASHSRFWLLVHMVVATKCQQGESDKGTRSGMWMMADFHVTAAIPFLPGVHPRRSSQPSAALPFYTQRTSSIPTVNFNTLASSSRSETRDPLLQPSQTSKSCTSSQRPTSHPFRRRPVAVQVTMRISIRFRESS